MFSLFVRGDWGLLDLLYGVGVCISCSYDGVCEFFFVCAWCYGLLYMVFECSSLFVIGVIRVSYDGGDCIRISYMCLCGVDL